METRKGVKRALSWGVWSFALRSSCMRRFRDSWMGRVGMGSLYTLEHGVMVAFGTWYLYR
jgi:hypothetical protein